MTNILSHPEEFWSQQYLNQQTGWDLGSPSPAIIGFCSKLNKDCRILIPGCGNAYEAQWLLENGFKNITLLDISKVLTDKLKAQFKNDKRISILHVNFFDHHGNYDVILEQTFFCALHPSFRPRYAHHMHSLLIEGGLIAGVLFNRQFENGPPFGGDKTEYEKLFSPFFTIETMTPCYNSIPQRTGSELFIVLRKKMNEAVG